MKDELIDDDLNHRTIDENEIAGHGDSSSNFESLLVYDEQEECPYLPGQIARMPLQFPVSSINPARAASLLETGFRRSGKFLYRASCPNCVACEPIRVRVSQFLPSRAQKRALKKGNVELEFSLGPPICDEEHVTLFNEHRNVRGLNRQGTNIDIQDYRMFLVDSCLDSFEISYFHHGQFVGAAICDQAADSISAVYTFFDPKLSRLSLGVYSILKQIEYCLEKELAFLYLGYFVGGSPHMNYKQKFRPHQRLQKGAWIDYS